MKASSYSCVFHSPGLFQPNLMSETPKHPFQFAGKPHRHHHPLLLKYLSQLNHHPLRTKAITVGVLCFLQEVLASHLAGTPANVSKGASAIVRSLQSAHLSTKAIKMAIYGFLVSAPLSHFLVGLVQKSFAGRTGTRPKVAQIIVNSLFVSPIQASGNSVPLKINTFLSICFSTPCVYGRDQWGNFT